MNTEERHKLFKQILWDYNISAAEVDDVLHGKRNLAGHYDKQRIFIKLLESYSWFTIIQLFSTEEIRQLLSDDVIKKLRFKSLRVKYEFVQKRLQTLIQVSE
jgi:aromatic ring hydroxylase